MKQLLFLSIVFASLSFCAKAQLYNPAKKSIVWQLTPVQEHRIALKFGAKTINLGGYQGATLIVSNLTSSKLKVKIQITLTDYCQTSSTHTVEEVVQPNATIGGDTWQGGSEQWDYQPACKEKQEMEKGYYSKINRVDYEILDIRDLTEEKRQEQQAAEQKKREEDLAAQKKEKERKDAEAEKQKREAEENQKAAANKIQASNGNTTNGQNGNKTDDDFWETGKKTNSNTSGNQNAGNMANDRAQQIAKQQEDTKKAKEAADQKAVDDFFTKQKTDKQENEQYQKKLQENTALADKAWNASTAATNAKSELRDNSKLSGGYENVDQLMAEYNQKMANISRLSSEMSQQSNQAIAAQVNLMNRSGSAQEAALGEGIKALGAIANSLNEAKERRKAQEALRAEKAAALREMQEEKAAIEAQKVAMLTGMRKDLFSRFGEGAFPLSSTKLEANTIYYFVYAYDPQQIAAKQPVLYLSNVFPVSRYSDGTWPFKSSIAGEIAALTPYAEVMHGYYTSAQEAQAMRQGMQDIFVKTGGYVQTVNYKGKVSAAGSSANASGDFWETGKKATTDSTTKKPVKKDDFWNN